MWHKKFNWICASCVSSHPHWQRLNDDDDDDERKQRGDCEKDINMWRYFDVCAITLVVCAECEEISQSNGY